MSRTFLERVRDDLLAALRMVEEAAPDAADYPDLEAAIRLAWREAAREVAEERGRIGDRLPLRRGEK